MKARSRDQEAKVTLAAQLRRAHDDLDWLLASWVMVNVPVFEPGEKKPSELTVLELSKWAIHYAKQLEEEVK